VKRILIRGKIWREAGDGTPERGANLRLFGKSFFITRRIMAGDKVAAGDGGGSGGG